MMRSTKSKKTKVESDDDIARSAMIFTPTKETTEEIEKRLTAKEKAAGDPDSLEGIPGLGPAGIKNLNANMIFTAWDLLTGSDPVKMKDITAMDVDECGKAFLFISKRFTDAGILSPKQMTATEHLAKRKLVKRIKTDCKGIDQMLDGGIECGLMTQVWGEGSAGKTDLMHVLCVTAQLPISQGGLAEENKIPPIVFFIQTEPTFRPERIVSIARGKGLISDYPADLKNKIAKGAILSIEDIKVKQECEAIQEKESQKFLANIITVRVTDVMDQMRVIKNVIFGIKHVPVRLLIIDSATQYFRNNFLGRGAMYSKFAYMNEMLADLTRLAEYNDVAVVVVNQIYNSPDATKDMGQDEDKALGGNIFEHAVPMKIKLAISGGKRKCELTKSPYQPKSSVKFILTEAGLSDVPEKEKK